MVKTIGLATLKGGTGKTTTSVGIADRLTNEGISCALIDADPQASLTTWEAVTQGKPGALKTPVNSIGADVKPAQMSRICRSFAESSDAQFSIIDNGPGNIDRIDATIEIIADTGGVLIIPSATSYLDLAQAVVMLKEVGDRAPTTILLTQTRAITSEEANTRRDLAELDAPVMMATVPQAVQIQRAIKGDPAAYKTLLAIYEPVVIELLGLIG